MVPTARTSGRRWKEMDLNFGKKVLYATKERIQNRWRLREIEGRGILSTTDEGVRFKGRRHDFEINEIQAASMTKDSPGLALAITGPLFVAAGYSAIELFLSLLFEGSGASFLDIGRADVIYVIGVSVIVVLLSLFRQEHWIRVEYRGADGQPCEVFFRRLPFRNPEVLLNQLRWLTVEER